MLRASWLLAFLLVGCREAPPVDPVDRDDESLVLAVQPMPEGLPESIPFDGKRAMSYLEQICKIGPRMSGTKGMREQQALIRKHFEDLGLKIEDQAFRSKQVSSPEIVDFCNLIVRLKPEAKRRVILCTHYDTRPKADQEPNPRRWTEPFVSANDGGSGVAFLMEFAHHVSKLKLEVGVDLVFFDAEEYVWTKEDNYFIGSKQFAKLWKADPKRPVYLGAVLLDMIAGKNPRFPVEDNSFRRANKLTIELWSLALNMKLPAFQNRMGSSVLDDHISLLDAGIPAVDIIDFDYPHWHRLSDTPANCSPDGMLQVSKLLSTWVQMVK